MEKLEVEYENLWSLAPCLTLPRAHGNYSPLPKRFPLEAVSPGLYEPSYFVHVRSKIPLINETIWIFIFIIAQLWLTSRVDFSSEKYNGCTGHWNSCYQARNFQWGCWWWDLNSQPLGYKPSALVIELTSSKAITGKELSLSSWCIASL